MRKEEKKADTFILKGNICYSKTEKEVTTIPHAYLLCRDGICQGVFESLPDDYKEYPLTDYGDALILPGLVDLHLHAPQYAFTGLGMDMELLEWLDTRTFPEEGRYGDMEYAKKAYRIFTEDLKKSATTRACVFATRHVPATILLMDMLEETGLKAMVGKVNMDRNAPDYLCEESAERSAEDTLLWLKEVGGRYKNIRPILTPRFIPSCSDRLMKMLSGIRREYDLPIQSHLSENKGEIAWVKELCPWSAFYGDAYEQFGMFGGTYPAVMAHCVHPTEEEIGLMKKNGVFAAHCPHSNTDLSSGVAPIRRYLEEGIHVGLGSDIAGGHVLSLFQVMVGAVQASKLRWRLEDETQKPLTVDEVFYMGTKGGGAFFGKVGSFEKGYEFDAVVVDDTRLKTPRELTLKERLERVVYLSDDRDMTGKYVAGRRII